MALQVYHEKSGALIADQVEIAGTFWQRLIGLLGRSGIKQNQGLLLPECNAVHSFMMRFPIDILFLDQERIVTKTVHRLKPNRMMFSSRRTRNTLELASGMLARYGVKVGDRITFTKK